MKNILEKIIADKRIEIAQKKKFIPETYLRSREDFQQECVSLRHSLEEDEATGIITEFKRKSPSKGWIHKDADVTEIVSGFEMCGASGVSILTDEMHFGGTLDDLINGRLVLSLPILRKDFVIDEYQVIESKAWGADVILLIAACLTKEQVKKLAFQAKQIGLEVLLEIHDEKELDHINDYTEMVGVNNRNLKTFEVDIERSLRMAEKIPPDRIKIAESGIDSIDDILLFRKHGFQGFLMGEHFMKQADPGLAFGDFVKKLKAKINEHYQ